MFGKLFLIGLLVLGASIFLSPQVEDKGELNVLPHELSGNNESKVMLVFLHGYPNTFRLWDKTIELVKDDYYCVNLSFPNFAESVTRKWGTDIPEIIVLMKKTLEELDPTGKYKKVFVAHDWGAGLTYNFDRTFPGYIADLIALDIGIGNNGTTKTLIGMYGYQSYLALNFLIGGPVGRYLTRVFALNAFGRPYGLSEEDLERYDASWNYLYYYKLKNQLLSTYLTTDYHPSCPVVFIYASDKSLMFHSERYLNLLREDPKSEILTVTGGHWFMETNNDLIVSTIRKRAKKFE